MSWISPETDWSPGDGIKANDLNRIEGNVEELGKNRVHASHLVATDTGKVWGNTQRPVWRLIMARTADQMGVAWYTGFIITNIGAGSYLTSCQVFSGGLQGAGMITLPQRVLTDVLIEVRANGDVFVQASNISAPQTPITFFFEYALAEDA